LTCIGEKINHHLALRMAGTGHRRPWEAAFRDRRCFE
jgi:hypothetical protein